MEFDGIKKENYETGEEVLSMSDTGEDYIEHIGIVRRSGRYPWGSGKDPHQRSRQFKAYMDEMKAKGLTETQIAKGLGIKTTELRAGIAISTEHIFAENQAMAYRLKDKGMSNVAIAERMGTNESTVRGWLKKSQEIKEGSLKSTANAIKEQLNEKEFLDVGKGSHLYMGVSDTKFKTALAMMADEGYNIWTIKNPQLGTGNLTTYRVLTHPGVAWAEARKAVIEGRLRVIAAQSDDGGLTFMKPSKPEPVSVDLKRIDVRWAEQGGTKMDGVIELRRGVEDLSLGKNNYAQVRVAVNGTHYLKGMAMYADDLPHGVDIRFNTNKPQSSDKLSAMKPLKDDPDNRFGATSRPHMYKDKAGKVKTSPLNMVNEEGNWYDWSKSLSSQMLSKQPITLASTQLGEARAKHEESLKKIMALTNPVVKQKMLKDFAETADAAAVHLKAAAFERQSTHVILPINSVRPHEIYAPNFKNGEKVVLIRHPHGGPFEIPELTVNNKNITAKRILGAAIDAVGIHHKVAEQLSGADFDGDTVLVIPNDSRKVKTRPPLEGLKGFDPKSAYPGYGGMVRMSKKNTQTEMGRISNLITDMTLHNANDDELARAVKHSMVVIDAEKHGLNYKQSELDNGIKALKTKYQGGPRSGASTLISRASSEASVPQQKLRMAAKGGPIDSKTGKLVYEKTGAGYDKTTTKVSKRTGEIKTTSSFVLKTTKGTKMEFADDARSLLSAGGGTPMERVYADHANSMKSLANKARKEMVSIKLPKQSKAAAAIYAPQVKSLDNKLRIALRNAPLERRAQVIGNAMAKAKIDANPGLDKDDIKKIKYQSLETARQLTGASKMKIGAKGPDGKSTLTDREWEAIQAGAVSPSKLREMLTHADMDRVAELATPRPRTSLTTGQLARLNQMSSTGKTPTQIADALGIPRSTVVDNLR